MRLLCGLFCLFLVFLTGCESLVRDSMYTVKPSDTVFSISRKFNVPAQQIIAKNRLRAPYHLAVNQKLYIPMGKTYTVRKGDTIYSLAQRYNVDYKTLAAYNDIHSPWTLRVGQKLRIPAKDAPIQKTASVSSSTPVVVKSSTKTSPVKPTVSKKQRAAALSVPKGSGKFIWPVSGQLVSRFGATGNGQKNDGINISTGKGAAVKAADNGVVAYAGNEIKGFGNLLLLKHDNNWMTAYAHNDTILVKRGDVVKQGQTIAKVGSTGNVNKPQLHFEIRKDSRAVDPLLYMK